METYAIYAEEPEQRRIAFSVISSAKLFIVIYYLFIVSDNIIELNVSSILFIDEEINFILLCSIIGEIC